MIGLCDYSSDHSNPSDHDDDNPIPTTSSVPITSDRNDTKDTNKNRNNETNNNNGNKTTTVMNSFQEEVDYEQMLYDRLFADIGKPDPKTTEKVIQFLRLKSEKGINLTNNIRSKKEFSNPRLLDKIIEYFKIEEV